MPLNLFDQSAVTYSVLQSASDGSFSAYSSTYYVSAMIAVTPGASYCRTQFLTDTTSTFGDAWFDGSGAFISGVPLPHTSGQVLVAPAGAAHIRLLGSAGSGTPIGSQMFVAGTTLPGSYVPFVPATPTLVFAAVPSKLTIAPPFAMSATSASTGAVTYAVTSGPATISGSTVTLTGATGTVVITATQASAIGFTSATATISISVLVQLPQTTILANACIGYADGSLVPTGLFSIQATDAQNNPIPFNGGNDVQATLKPVVWPITAGSIPTSSPTPRIATPTLTEPANIYYQIVITDTSVSPTVVTVYRKVQITADSSGNWDFSTYNTGLSVPAVPMAFVTGLQGVNGTNGTDGATSYATLCKNLGAALAYLRGVFGITSPNLVDPAAVVIGSVINADGSINSSGFSGYAYVLLQCAGLSQLCVNQAGNGSSSFSTMAFYDPFGTFLAGVAAPGLGVNGVYTVPAGAATAKFFTVGALSGLMIVPGATMPGTFVPYKFPIATQSVVSPGAGRKFAVLGDSISSIFNNKWQNVVASRLGMTLAWQSARPGRAFSTALEDFSLPSVGSAPGNYSTSYTYPGVGGTALTYLNTGITAGQSLATSLAALSGGALILRLGTNDQTVTVGSLGDSISAGTLYGNMRWVIEALLTAAPTLRLVVVGNGLNTFGTLAQIQGVDTAEQAIADAYSLPYLSLLRRGGNSTITTSTYTRDGTHPSDWNFTNVDGPAIAQFLQQWI